MFMNCTRVAVFQNLSFKETTIYQIWRILQPPYTEQLNVISAIPLKPALCGGQCQANVAKKGLFCAVTYDVI